jgi:carboxymethylenebutenolidase
MTTQRVEIEIETADGIARAWLHRGGEVAVPAVLMYPDAYGPRPAYLGVADEDRSCTPEHQGALAAALGAAHVEYRIEPYPGKKHGFAVTDHPGAYDADAAARHWRRLESFFGETLR